MSNSDSQKIEEAFFGNDLRKQLTFRLAYVGMAISVIGSFISVIIGLPFLAVAGAGLIGLSVLSLAVIKLGASDFGRFLYLFLGALVFVALHTVTPQVSQAPFLLMISVGTTFLLFSWSRDKVWIAVLLTSIVGVWGLSAVASYFIKLPAADLSEKQSLLLGHFGALVALGYLLLQHVIYTQTSEKHGAELIDERNNAIRANLTKSDFVSKMSHEIRTSLNAMLGTLQIMEKTQMTTEQLRMMRTVNKSSETLVRIVDDIMDSFNIVSGKLELSPIHVDLLNEVESTAEMLRVMADEKHARLKFYYDPDLPDIVLADPNRLRQIITNLVGNGLHFSSFAHSGENVDGLVELKITRSGSDEMKIIVSDNGVGMSEEQVERLFRSEQKSILHHKGLGVSVSRHLVELMGGKIEVETALGKGTTLKISLPLDPRKQRIDRVDLDGVSILALVGDQSFSERLQRYVESRGADYTRFSTVSDLCTALEGQPNSQILLLNEGDGPSAAQDLKVIRECSSEARVIRISNDRFESAGRKSNTEILLAAAPLLPSELWQSVAELSGHTAAMQAIENSVKSKSTSEEIESAGPKTVLIAEDNLINQQVLSQMLAIMGFNVEVAENGAVGLEKWQNGQFDFILADCQMPKMDGYEMTRQIRRFEHSIDRDPIKIIGVTANANADAQDRCLKSGMNAFIAKPVAMKELEKLLVHAD